MFHEPRDLLIECKSCGAESRFSKYVPEMHVVCSHCEEQLIDVDLNETHDEYVCEDCGHTQLLLKDTPFNEDENECRCGSASIIKMDSSSIAEEAEEAGALDRIEEGLEADTLDDEAEEEEDDEGLDDMMDEEEEEDWLRSDPHEIDEPDEFDEASDGDPGYG